MSILKINVNKIKTSTTKNRIFQVVLEINNKNKPSRKKKEK